MNNLCHILAEARAYPTSSTNPASLNVSQDSQRPLSISSESNHRSGGELILLNGSLVDGAMSNNSNNNSTHPNMTRARSLAEAPNKLNVQQQQQQQQQGGLTPNDISRALSIEHRQANMSQMSISSQLSKNSSIRNHHHHQAAAMIVQQMMLNSTTPRESLVFFRGDERPIAKILLQQNGGSSSSGAGAGGSGSGGGYRSGSFSHTGQLVGDKYSDQAVTSNGINGMNEHNVSNGNSIRHQLLQHHSEPSSATDIQGQANNMNNSSPNG